MADNPFLISRAALFEALKNDRVARAVERLLQIASANLVAEILLAAANEAYPAGRVLLAGTGIDIDTTTPGELTISATGTDNPTFTNATVTDDLTVGDDGSFGGDVTVGGDLDVSGPVTSGGLLKGASLELTGSPSTWTGTLDFSLPVTIDGVTLYLALSTTP